jgi:hypothetical protein
MKGKELNMRSVEPVPEAAQDKVWLHPLPERVREQIHSLLRAWGMSETQARSSAEVMVDTDLSGVDSHGISMLIDYDRSRRNGRLNLDAEPRIVREKGVTALVDADAGLGHAAAVMATNLAIERAREMGVGIVCVRNSHHFGAAGYYVRMAAAAGFAGAAAGLGAGAAGFGAGAGAALGAAGFGGGTAAGTGLAAGAALSAFGASCLGASAFGAADCTGPISTTPPHLGHLALLAAKVPGTLKVAAQAVHLA